MLEVCLCVCASVWCWCESRLYAHVCVCVLVRLCLLAAHEMFSWCMFVFVDLRPHHCHLLSSRVAVCITMYLLARVVNKVDVVGSWLVVLVVAGNNTDDQLIVD